MCVSLAPARFSNTTLYAAEITAFTDSDNALPQTVHVMGYQNTVQDLSTRDQGVLSRDEWGWDHEVFGSGGGNAMILPIPTDKPLSPRNLVDTRSCPKILDDLVRSAMLGDDVRPMSLQRGSVASAIQIFDHDVYTVVLAQSASLGEIVVALQSVPDTRRPRINENVFSAYSEWYKNWAIAICCFNNEDARRAAPLLWRYVPKYPERLFAPALDSHTGRAPDLSARVEVDHVVVVGSTEMKLGGGQLVSVSRRVPEAVQKLLTTRVIGKRFYGKMPNGDFVFRVQDVRSGEFAPKRLLPPGVSPLEELALEHLPLRAR